MFNSYAYAYSSEPLITTSLPTATIPIIASPQSIDPPSHFVQSPSHVEIHQVTSSPAQQKEDSPRCRRSSSSSFYGASSHPHVSFPNDESLLALANGVKTDAGYIDLDPSSRHLRDSLLREFFKYQILLVELVDEGLFSRHRGEDGIESRWYSKFLENTILACSSRLSTSESVRRLGVNYYELAKEGVSNALYEPSPANLQGFLLLSEYESTTGKNSLGWMYCGKCIACRMLTDLGLHELMCDTQDQDPSEEACLAYTLASGCLVYENIFAMYLGRPNSIPSYVVHSIMIRRKRNLKSDSAWLNAWVGLCTPMGKVSRALNEKSIPSPDERTTLLREAFQDLENWYDGLAPDLRYNKDCVTAMDLAGYGLHSQYCKTQILLRQSMARLSNTRKRPHSLLIGEAPLLPPQNNFDPTVYQYAIRIARLTVTYKEAFGVERIPTVMLDNCVVAATVMIEFANALHSRPEDTIWFNHLIKSMEALRAHFPVVRRMLVSLSRMVDISSPLHNILHSSSDDGTCACYRQVPSLRPPLNDGPTSPIPQDRISTDESHVRRDWDFDPNNVPDVLPLGEFGTEIFGLLQFEA
ncbi:unnamed protein product [Clonostachys solani]|uniref:Xylanolytic transcriptional activator regulatory domain-containing protein n=1 Tax=Clonostachys solani TaxID=160281 RepID=A0A9N9ZIS2_9HYPO|nr:unnamed protein product [Clonostachys solani]